LQTAILITIYIVWPNSQNQLFIKYANQQLRTEPATAMGPGVEGEDEDERVRGIELSVL
jgi:hypothetical protein